MYRRQPHPINAVRAALLAACFCASGMVRAQTEPVESYPSRPIQLMMPFSAGGASDVIARQVAILLGKDLGQQVVVMNVAGATGSIGTLQVARAKPDGYMLLLGTAGTIINNPNLNKDVGYDPLRDFQAVTALWGQPTVVLVHKDAGLHTLKDLIAEGRRHPGKLTFGSGGVGSFGHLGGGLFAAVAGVKLTHVPNKGVGPAVTDLMAKNLDICFSVTSSLVGNTDRLLGLAIAAKTRSGAIPNVPTSAEAGLPDFLYSSWGGLFAPAGISPRTADKLSAAAGRALSGDAVRRRFEALGVELEHSTPAEYTRAIAAEFAKGRQLVEITRLREYQ